MGPAGVIDAHDLELLRQAAEQRGRIVQIVVTGCAYSCCGKGWHRRDGYEQTYQGWVDNFKDGEHGVFMLYSPGLGTLNYVVAVRFDEVADVQAR